VFFDKLTFMYLEMPKFDKGEKELVTYEDWWLYIVRNLVQLNDKPADLRDKVFEKFFKAAEIARFTPEQRLAYEISLKNMRDYHNTLNSAEEKGYNRGHEEGREEGLEQGMQKGATEKAREIARAMLRAGLPVETIEHTTGLSAAEILAL